MNIALKNIGEGKPFYRKLYYCTKLWVRAPEALIGAEGFLCHEVGNPLNTVRLQPSMLVMLESNL